MILTTGAKGWIGIKLCEKVGGVGLDVKDGMNLLTCDLPENIDVIYHLAAQASVEASWSDPLHDLDNIRTTARLVHKYPNAKLIYTNSAASLDRSSPYGFSKWAAGEYLKKFHTNYVICTLPNVYGHGSRSVVDLFKGRKKVTIYGSGEHTRDYVHVYDIVDGLVMAQNWPVGEYQMGSGISTRVIDLARNKEVFYAKDRKESPESVLTNSTPNWTPKIKLFDYLYD